MALALAVRPCLPLFAASCPGLVPGLREARRCCEGACLAQVWPLTDTAGQPGAASPHPNSLSPRSHCTGVRASAFHGRLPACLPAAALG